MGSAQHTVQSIFFSVLQGVKNNCISVCRSEIGGDLEKHNQGHHRISLEKHTPKKINLKAIFFQFP